MLHRAAIRAKTLQCQENVREVSIRDFFLLYFLVSDALLHSETMAGGVFWVCFMSRREPLERTY